MTQPLIICIYTITISLIASPAKTNACKFTSAVGSINCDDICINTGVESANGRYIWTNDNVHFCEFCYDPYGNNLYIYPWILNQTMYWFISGNHTSKDSWLYIHCYVGIVADFPVDYTWDIKDCISWYYWDDGWGIWYEFNPERINYCIECVDICYYKDESSNSEGAHSCIDDCDCNSLRTCSEAGWCQGTGECSNSAIITCADENVTPITGSLTGQTTSIMYSFTAPTELNRVTFTLCNDYTPTMSTTMTLFDSNFIEISNDGGCEDSYYEYGFDCDITTAYYTSRCEAHNLQNVPTIIIGDELITSGNVYYLSINYDANGYGNYGLQVICMIGVNTNCSRISEMTSTCYFDNIQLLSDQKTDIMCDNNYKNCQVQFGSSCDNCNIYVHCPNTNECKKCKIYLIRKTFINYANFVFKGYNCKFMEVNIDEDIYGNIIIDAPGSNGDLSVHIISNVQTQLVINPHPLSTNNVMINVTSVMVSGISINANNISGDLNISCEILCSYKGSNIICPQHQDTLDKTKCNIDCSSSSSNACQGLTVSAKRGTNDVNWFGCTNSDSTACAQAKLFCGYEDTDIGVSFDLYSEWIWTNTTGWEYNNDNCVNFSLPSNFTNVIPVDTSLLSKNELIYIIAGLSFVFVLLVVALVYYY
eukprot:333991_1